MNNLNLDAFAAALNQTEENADRIADELFFGTNSSNRLPRLLEALDTLPVHLGFKLLKDVWSNCDDTYAYTEAVTDFLQIATDSVEFVDYLTKPEREWFDALPDRFRVYRGSDASRCAGLSWTTSRDVALGFARGHRGIQNNAPVLLSGVVTKSRVLMATNDRTEFEILARFAHVKEKRIVSYQYYGDRIIPA